MTFLKYWKNNPILCIRAVERPLRGVAGAIHESGGLHKNFPNEILLKIRCRFNDMTRI